MKGLKGILPGYCDSCTNTACQGGVGRWDCGFRYLWNWNWSRLLTWEFSCESIFIILAPSYANYSRQNRFKCCNVHDCSYLYFLDNGVTTTVNPLLSPPGDLFFSRTFEGEGGLIESGGLFNLAKNTVVSDRVDLRVVQFKSLSKVFNSLVGA